MRHTSPLRRWTRRLLAALTLLTITAAAAGLGVIILGAVIRTLMLVVSIAITLIVMAGLLDLVRGRRPRLAIRCFDAMWMLSVRSGRGTFRLVRFVSRPVVRRLLDALALEELAHDRRFLRAPFRRSSRMRARHRQLRG